MTRTPPGVRTGERYEKRRADELGAEDRGRIVATPGHRGWLQNAQVEEDGGVWVCSTTGVAVYPPDTEFSVWGFDDRDKVRKKWDREQAKRFRQYEAAQSGKGLIK